MRMGVVHPFLACMGWTRLLRFMRLLAACAVLGMGAPVVAAPVMPVLPALVVRHVANHAAQPTSCLQPPTPQRRPAVVKTPRTVALPPVLRVAARAHLHLSNCVLLC